MCVVMHIGTGSQTRFRLSPRAMNSQTPIIPQRPRRNKPESSTAEADAALELDQQEVSDDVNPTLASNVESTESPSVPVIPSIPKRPSRSRTQSTSQQLEILPSIPKRPVSKKQTLPAKEGDEDKEIGILGAEAVNTSFSLPDRSTYETEVPGEQLNSDLQNSDGEDVNRTPSNTHTKVSLKDGSSSRGSIVSEADSAKFNDDAETVLQEGEDSESITSPAEEGEESPTPESNGVQKFDDEASIEEADSVNLLGKSAQQDVNETEKPEIEQVTSGDNPKKLDNASDEDGVHGLKVTSNSTVAKETEVKPIGPEEVEVYKPTSEDDQNMEQNEKDLKQSSSLASDESPSTTKDEVSESAIDSRPIIPVRPSKTHNKQKENPENFEPKPSYEEKKKPPPKPKPLSSKIAAFQNMFENSKQPIQPQKPVPPRPIRRKTVDTSEEPELAEDNPESHGKLSEKHMAFAKNLKGVMGQGIPLPGLARPLALVSGTQDQNEESNDLNAGDPESLSKTRPTRGRPSRNRKLPSNLKTPAQVDSDDSKTLSVLTLWEIDLSLNQAHS